MIRLSFTPEAASALERAGVSRRRFLETSGVLIVGFGLGPVTGALTGTPSEAQAQTPPDRRTQLDAWIAIAADGAIAAYTGKCDLGQGMYTVQTQLVAEELSVPMSRVRLVQSDTALTPDQGTTSGDESHRTNFRNANLAQAAATAREALLGLAARQLGVPVEQLTLADGVIGVTADPVRRVSYGGLIGGRQFGLALNPAARRKPASAWTVLGKPAPRLDIPALVTGQFEFVHNVHVPGMAHGRVVMPPTVGATLVSVDESSVNRMPGFVRVFTKHNFVGVVAEKPWQALQIAGALRATWKAGPRLPDQASYYDSMRTLPSQDTIWVDSGDVDTLLAGATTVMRSTYVHPYQMHASIASSCAVADVQGDRATIWSATQNVYGLRSTSAMVLELRPENIHVVFVRGSGCYGINGVDTASYAAGLLSRAAGRPVRVQLTRRDEMAWENFGAAFLVDQQAGLDAEGRIVAWDYSAWFAGRGGRVGMGNPGNVAGGFHAGFQPAAFAPRPPAPATAPFNDQNSAPSYVMGCVGGACDGKGTIAGERAIARRVDTPFFTGPLRAPAQLQNTFAHESFMDELAASGKADPVAFRLKHLRDPRLIDVINAAAKAAGWEARPSPRGGQARTGMARGRGIAAAAMESGEFTNGWIAMVADVRVDQGAGRVAVDRLVIAHDCGAVSNPDGLRNQLEGAALQAMSRALVEEVTWDDEKITSVDWQTYPILSLGTTLPTIDIVLIDRPDVPPTGAGETACATVAAALGNAVFDATGARLRQVPFTPERVRRALASRQL